MTKAEVKDFRRGDKIKGTLEISGKVTDVYDSTITVYDEDTNVELEIDASKLTLVERLFEFGDTVETTDYRGKKNRYLLLANGYVDFETGRVEETDEGWDVEDYITDFVVVRG